MLHSHFYQILMSIADWSVSFIFYLSHHYTVALFILMKGRVFKMLTITANISVNSDIIGKRLYMFESSINDRADKSQQEDYRKNIDESLANALEMIKEDKDNEI